MVIVDVVKALGHGTLEGSVYLYDNNRDNGSVGEGTGDLSPLLLFAETDAAKPDIEVMWNIIALEPEAFAELSHVAVDGDYMEVKQCTYAGSDVGYWIGRVKKRFKELTCEISVKLGNHEQEFLHSFQFRGQNIEK